jgi:DNA-binding CsgD family transcriptional regulator
VGWRFNFRQVDLFSMTSGSLPVIDKQKKPTESGTRAQLAEAILRATRVRHVVIGRVSLRGPEILEADVAGAQGREAARAIAEAAQTIARTVGFQQRQGGDREVDLAVEGADQTAVAWLGSERCLVGLWRRQADVTPFVALIRESGTHAFPRWQRDVARIGMMYESDRMRWLRSGNAPAPSASAVTEVIRHVAVALALVDASRGVVFTNDAAERWLGRHDRLRLVDGRLTAQTPDLQRRLCAAVRVAAAGEPRRPTVLVLRGDISGGVPELITCLPLSNLAGHALLIFADRPRDAEIADLLLNALGLTGAERRLARQLLVGRTLEDAARETNIKLSTARSYLKGIFAKTGVRRQSELVAVVGGLVPPVIDTLPPGLDEPRAAGAA